MSGERTKLQPLRLSDSVRAHGFGNIVIAGQPTADDLRSLSANGTQEVVDLRMADEDRGFAEQACVVELGMNYRHFGFCDAETLTDEIFTAVRALLAGSARRPVLLHCASANRVGALWIAHRVLDNGLAYDAAHAEAVTIGLKSLDYAERAKAYVTYSSARGECSRIVRISERECEDWFL